MDKDTMRLLAENQQKVEERLALLRPISLEEWEN